MKLSSQESKIEGTTSKRYSRRTVLRASLGIAGAGLLAACGGQGGGKTPTTGAAGSGTGGGTQTTPTTSAGGTGGGTAQTPTTTSASTSMAAQATSTSGPVAGTTPSGATTPASGMTPAMTMGPQVSGTASVPGMIPSPGKNVPPAYTQRPEPFKSVQEVPGKGGPMKEVTAMWVSYAPPPTPRDQNKYWQGLDERLGVKWSPSLIPVDSYSDKFATLVAGQQIPAIIWLSGLTSTAPKLIQQGAFTDLTDYLTGDALKEYPNLAKLPSHSWDGTKFEGKVYGLPWPIPVPNSPNWIRRDWAKKQGTWNPKNSDEYYKMLQGFTKDDPDGDGKQDTWAIAEQYRVFNGMFHVPYDWKVNDNGSLTNAMETDEWKQAIAYTRKAFADGLFVPDYKTAGYQQRYDEFRAGKAGIMDGGLVNILPLRQELKKVDPKADVFVTVPPGKDGGQGYTYNTSGSFGYFAIPSTIGKDPEKLKQVLRIANWFAAPFGSEERIYKNNGIKGWDYKVDKDGSFVATDKGNAEIGNMFLIINNETIIFDPDPAQAKIWQDAAQAIAEVGIDNPVQGLYSPTDVSKGPNLDKFVTDAVNGFIYGRKPLSDIDSFLQQWKQRGGDQIRKEYEASLKRSKQSK